MIRSLRGAVVALCVSSAAIGSAARAASGELEALRAALEQQRQRLEIQQQALERERVALEAQVRRLEQLAYSVPAASRQPVGEAPQEGALPDTGRLFNEPGFLAAPRSLAFEPAIQYSQTTNQRITLLGYSLVPAVVVGAIDLREVASDTLVASLTARYGLTRRIEIDARVPYVWRTDRVRTRPLGAAATADEMFEGRGQGLGDAEVALRWQINHSFGDGAVYIANLRLRAPTGADAFGVERDPRSGLARSLPTGSGFWGAEPGITATLRSDPAVFFGNVSYLWNFARDTGAEFGRVDPGDVIGLNFGMGVALNERSSFSLGYQHNVVMPTERLGAESFDAPLHLGSLLFGYSARFGTRSWQLSLAAGLTAEAPDTQLALRVPL